VDLKDAYFLYIRTMYGLQNLQGLYLLCDSYLCVHLTSVPANPPVAENSDVSSVRSMATLQSQSSLPTPAPDEGLGSDNQAGLYLIRCVCVCSGTLIKGHL